MSRADDVNRVIDRTRGTTEQREQLKAELAQVRATNQRWNAQRKAGER